VTDGATRSHPQPQPRLDISIGKHLDEVFIQINGEQKYLWGAVDQDGMVLDILVQNRRDTAAARSASSRRSPHRRRPPQAHVDRTGVSERHRPRRERGSGTEPNQRLS
jgi:putative transposase